jgi:aryl sulfotransferase
MGDIVWLASYPKSGNTWVRAFLTNYLDDRSTPADINDLTLGLAASARHLFDEVVGVEASDLTPDEIARHRPAVYRYLARETNSTIFLKVHDAFRLPGEAPLFPLDAAQRAVYLIRNPLDVAVSLAHHWRSTTDVVIDRMCRRSSLSPSGPQLHDQLEQVMLSWSDHVRSWAGAEGLAVFVVRYEDLIRTPQATFGALLDAIGQPVDAARLSRAIEFSSFKTLRGQEEAAGFVERPTVAHAFFRGGRTGDGRDVLTEAQVARIESAHAEVMREFGYLPGRS